MPDITEQELDTALTTMRIAIWNNDVSKFEKSAADADAVRLIAAYREVREQLRLRLAEPIFAECQAANRALNEARNELAELTRDLNVKLCDELEEVSERLAHYTTHDHAPCMYCDPLRSELSEARAEIERLKTSSVGLAQRVPNGWGT